MALYSPWRHLVGVEYVVFKNGQYSERHFVMKSRNDLEANWYEQTNKQDHVLSEADALTVKKRPDN